MFKTAILRAAATGVLWVVPAIAQLPKTSTLLAAGREPVNIVCIGDSITGVYYHTGGLRAYPEMLEVALRQIYPQAKVKVRNAGISGDTTRGALARLERDVLSHKPHLVTIMFGMNDLVRVPLEEFKKSLQQLTTRCRQAGAEVLLCTQNSVMETPARPSTKLREFTAAIRDVGKGEAVPVADSYAAYEELRGKDPLEWALLHSDEIHPNMAGHKVFASAIAKAISGKQVDLAAVGPPGPALRHTRALLEAGKPVKVLAMPPYDQLIAAAITELYPQSQVTVTPWPTAGQSLSQLREAAKRVRKMEVDLVLLAVPASATAETPQAFHHDYAWIMNWSLSFGPQQWDVLPLLPSLAKPTLTTQEQQHEAMARRVIAAQDLTSIARMPGDATPTAGLLQQWLKAQWRAKPN